MKKALSLVVLFGLVGSAMAGGKTTWSGRDADGDTYRFVSLGGGEWTGSLPIDGKTVRIKYKEGGSFGDCIELYESGDSTSRIRIYNTRLETNSTGRWVELTKGRWTN